MQAAIRPAVATDLDALVAIETLAFQSDRLSRRSLRRHLHSPRSRVLVAVEGGETVGYGLILLRAASRNARLYSLAASRPGTGLGRLLLTAAEEAAAAAGCISVTLEVRADNQRAIRLYENFGYRQVDRVEGYYADGEAALKLRKPLHPAGTSRQ